MWIENFSHRELGIPALRLVLVLVMGINVQVSVCDPCECVRYSCGHLLLCTSAEGNSNTGGGVAVRVEASRGMCRSKTVLALIYR